MSGRRKVGGATVLVRGLLFFTSVAVAACREDGRSAVNDPCESVSADSACYDLGRPATPQVIAALDVDVGPHGKNLPPGSGSVADGQAVYANSCQRCHGVNGAGMPPANPMLVGRDPKAEGFRFALDPALPRTIGNYWPHAYTLFGYIRRAMPLDAPRTLSDSEIYAVTAYLLHANGVIAADAVLDAAALRGVRMPYADRFVRDDRTGGPVVR